MKLSLSKEHTAAWALGRAERSGSWPLVMNGSFGSFWGGGSLDRRSLRVRGGAHLIQPPPLTEGKWGAREKGLNCPRPYRALVAEKG